MREERKESALKVFNTKGHTPTIINSRVGPSLKKGGSIIAATENQIQGIVTIYSFNNSQI